MSERHAVYRFPGDKVAHVAALRDRIIELRTHIDSMLCELEARPATPGAKHRTPNAQALALLDELQRAMREADTAVAAVRAIIAEPDL